jgi:hypothetical protein
MHAATVTYGHLSVSWDQYGTLTVARTDHPGAIQLSVSEWAFLLKAMELHGWPIIAPLGYQQANAELEKAG